MVAAVALVVAAAVEAVPVDDAAHRQLLPVAALVTKAVEGELLQYSMG
eukprot:SAG25_NODE_932_length_4679_cov_8.188210_9_plen_48_part_00